MPTSADTPLTEAERTRRTRRPSDRAITTTPVLTGLVAAAISTLISGRLVDMYGTRRIVIVLLILMAGGSIIPVSTGRAAVRFDLVGAIGFAIGLIGILLGISKGREWGWTSPTTLELLVGGVVVPVARGVVELRTPGAARGSDRHRCGRLRLRPSPQTRIRQHGQHADHTSRALTGRLAPCQPPP
jgi:MFS family permease